MSDLVIAGLLPELQPLARLHFARAYRIGIDISFTSGYRTPAEQTALYSKGRVLEAGLWHVTDPHLIVTNALPASGAHVRGAAYDIVPIIDEKPMWNRLDLFSELGRLGKELGLVWGGDWHKFKDLCHFELADWRNLPIPNSTPMALT